jgi:hypothetical protein
MTMDYGWVGVRMSAEEKEALQELAARDGRTMSSLIRKWLRDARKQQLKLA